MAAPHTFNIQSGFSTTASLNQGSQPFQYATNASQATWSHVGNSGRPVEQDLQAPGQMYAGTYAYSQSTPDLFQRDPTLLNMSHPMLQIGFQAPHASNPETPGTIFQPGFPYAHMGAKTGPPGTSAEICRDWQGLGPVCHPPMLPSHHYNDEYEYAYEYDEENGDDGDDNGTGRRQ